MTKLDTAPYKGVRDFYPEDMRIRKHLFQTLRGVVERFGYAEYDASPLEPAALYRAKSGEEIVSEQTYSFTDRGGREVTLRPEMTPTLARMVAAKKRDLGFPLRWYSIPNLFRYESPQKGRLREHYQLNVDVFGITDLSAEIEVIEIAYRIMKAFGADDSHFSILINSRKLLNKLFALFELSEESTHTLSKLIDKKEKVDRETFESSVEAILGERTKEFLELLNSNEKLMMKIGEEDPSVKQVVELIERLSKLGITNVIFTPTLMRGFDYYTDIVFEIFDNHPENRRSLFGGGRYDNLLELFGKDVVPAVGFGMGDVTLRDFLEVHELLPVLPAETHAILSPIGGVEGSALAELAERLRSNNLNIALNTIAKKPADAIKSALKQGIRYLVFVSEDEIAKREYTLKNLTTEETKTVSETELIATLQS